MEITDLKNIHVINNFGGRRRENEDGEVRERGRRGPRWSGKARRDEYKG